MGVISRRVLPVCGSMCFFCPALRARSRQPVKRYKKLLADIFLLSTDGVPNDRQISKLCEYAARNPLRIPKITTSLEQRFYKDLRCEQFPSVKVVMCIYRKLLVSCSDQIPLFASSFLTIIHILLDQTRHEEMQILGCQVLFDFVRNQTDGTYMLNLDDLISKVCQLAQEKAEEERTDQHLRAAGLQALSSMIWFMGKFPHISAEFDNVVSVILENCGGFKKASTDVVHDNQDSEDGSIDKGFSSSSGLSRVSSWRSFVDDEGDNVSEEDSKNPRFWARVCLHNMAQLAKEATTVRRVLESLFRYFDNVNLWSPEQGLALSVLQDMQSLIERSGQNTHFLLSILIKHLDHKNVLKNPNMQLDIVNVATVLARQTRVQSSVAIIGALSDMIRHLRKSIHSSLDDSSLGAEIIQYNRKFEAAVDECLIQLTHKVGDAGPVLDIMAVLLENMSNITVMSRTLIAAIYRTAQIVAVIPNISYQNKAFPEALFHQLLQAMVCPDHETRVGAHRIFSVVLVPSSVCPNTCAASSNSTRATDLQRTLSRTASVFSSSAALFRKLRKDQHSHQGDVCQEKREKTSDDGYAKTNRVSTLSRLNSTFSRGSSVKSYHSCVTIDGTVDSDDANSETHLVPNRLKSTLSRAFSVNRSPSMGTEDEKRMGSFTEKTKVPLRLTSHQISLLMSSIWAQSISPLNTPQNYEAIAHTYSLVLLFARSKNCWKEVLVRSFQIAFSLRNISLVGGGSLQPSRRRSIFTLATCMIIFSSKAFNISPLVASAKAALTGNAGDPFLRLVDDCKLEVIKDEQKQRSNIYGSKEDDEESLKSIFSIEITDNLSNECFASCIASFLEKLSDQESSSIREELLNGLMADDVLGAQCLEIPTQTNQFTGNESADNGEPILFIADNDGLLDTANSQRDPNITLDSAGLLSVDQLLDEVSDDKSEVERLSFSNAPNMTYSEMAGHCEARLMGKQKKMSSVMSIQRSHKYNQSTDMHSNSRVVPVVSTTGNSFLDPDTGATACNMSVASTSLRRCASEYQHQEYQHHPHYFRPPASSPFDNFLKVAGP